MNSDRLVESWCVGRCPVLHETSRHTNVELFTWKLQQDGPSRMCSSSGLEKVSSLSLVFLLSSDDPRPWDPRDTVAVEPSLCPSKFQELAELEPPEEEVAPASILHMRVVREMTFCSISANAAILVEKVLTICLMLVILDVREGHKELAMVWMWLS